METTPDSAITAGKASTWKCLAAHYKELRGTHLRQLFENDRIAARYHEFVAIFTTQQQAVTA